MKSNVDQLVLLRGWSERHIDAAEQEFSRQDTSTSTYDVVSVHVKEYSEPLVVGVSMLRIRGLDGSQVKLESVLNLWSRSGCVTFS